MTETTAPAPSAGARDIEPSGKAESAEPTADAVIGARIKDLRERAGLTQLELGLKIGRSDPFISQIENGRRSASRLTLGRLALAFGITLDELLDTGEKVGS